MLLIQHGSEEINALQLTRSDSVIHFCGLFHGRGTHKQSQPYKNVVYNISSIP